MHDLLLAPIMAAILGGWVGLPLYFLNVRPRRAAARAARDAS